MFKPVIETSNNYEKHEFALHPLVILSVCVLAVTVGAVVLINIFNTDKLGNVLGLETGDGLTSSEPSFLSEDNTTSSDVQDEEANITEAILDENIETSESNASSTTKEIYEDETQAEEIFNDEDTSNNSEVAAEISYACEVPREVNGREITMTVGNKAGLITEREVEIRFSPVTGAKFIMISENPNLSQVEPLPFLYRVPWVFTAGNGEKIIYAKLVSPEGCMTDIIVGKFEVQDQTQESSSEGLPYVPDQY